MQERVRRVGGCEPRANAGPSRASAGAHRPVRVALRSSDAAARRRRARVAAARPRGAY